MTVKEWLGEDNTLGIDIWERKYRFDNETFDEFLDRVSAEDSDLKQLIIDKKFLFGGRILANRGIKVKGKTYSNCFLAGTKVLTSEGYKNIEEIKKGELVYSHTGKWNKVNEVIKREYIGNIYKIQANNLLDPIFCTPNHKFLTYSGEWKAIEDFVIKSEKVTKIDRLMSPGNIMSIRLNSDCSSIKIDSIDILENYNTTVYNLSVENDHSYVVNGVFAHNCYVIPPVEDTIESIYETCGMLARTFSYGGGCGVDISKLRPSGAKVNNAAKTTTGAVSFMQTLSQVAETIGQRGRRKNKIA